MLCLQHKVKVIALSVLLICCTIVGLNSQYTYAQSSAYNLTSSYIVQHGDTLSAIAARYGVSLQEIATTNNLHNINSIRIGQVLIIPGISNSEQALDVEISSWEEPQASPPQAQSQPDSPQPVPVQPVPVQPVPVQPAQEQAVPPTYSQKNGAHADEVYTEESAVYIAPTYTAPTQAPASQQPATGCGVLPSASERIHNVHPGDTLYGIARTYGVSVTTVRQRNRLASDRIRVGECLVVPAGNSVTPVPDRRRSSEQPPVTNTPTVPPTPVTPVYTAQN